MVSSLVSTDFAQVSAESSIDSADYDGRGSATDNS